MSSLLLDRTDAVVTLTLNRPEAMNALDVDLKEALRDALASCASDKSCRAIVLADFRIGGPKTRFQIGRAHV